MPLAPKTRRCLPARGKFARSVSPLTWGDPHARDGSMPTPQRPPAACLRRPPTLSRSTLTLVTAVCAVVIRALLQPVIGDTMPLLIAYPAVVLAASMWGIASGLFV